MSARVCLLKATGRLIEYQSSPRPGTLIQNAVAAGFNAADVEERTVTPAEWAIIQDAWIDQPARDRQSQRETDRAAKVAKVKTKLGLTDTDVEDLRDAMRDL